MNNSQESFTPLEVIGWFSLRKMLLGQSTDNGHIMGQSSIPKGERISFFILIK